MTVRAKKIVFFDENNIRHCVHDVISVWLKEIDELDKVGDKKGVAVLKQKVIELEQVINRTGKPHIFFKNRNGNWSEKVIIE